MNVVGCCSLQVYLWKHFCIFVLWTIHRDRDLFCNAYRFCCDRDGRCSCFPGIEASCFIHTYYVRIRGFISVIHFAGTFCCTDQLVALRYLHGLWCLHFKSCRDFQIQCFKIKLILFFFYNMAYITIHPETVDRMLGNDVHFFLSICHGVLRERVCICLDINALFIFTQSTSGSVTADIKIIFVDWFSRKCHKFNRIFVCNIQRRNRNTAVNDIDHRTLLRVIVVIIAVGIQNRNGVRTLEGIEHCQIFII